VSAVDSLRSWTSFLKRDLLPDLHGHLLKCIATMSFAIATSGHCHSTRLAVQVPGRGHPASARRRFERLLGNTHLQPQRVFEKICRLLALFWSSRPIVLIIDGCDRDDHLQSLRIGVAYHHRMLPLLSIAYRPQRCRGGAPSLPRLLKHQLSLVHRWLGSQLEVTVLADRGLAWPLLVRLCRRFGWHFVLRLQHGTHVRIDGKEQTLGELIRRRDLCRCLSGEVFKKQGWMAVQVTAVWERRCREPWLLISDQNGGYARCRTYCKRMWCEQSFRDDKSEGFHWDKSRVNDLSHVNRLLVLMALATFLCIGTGISLVKRGLRHVIDCHRRRLLSYFKLGLRWLQWMQQDRHLPFFPLSLIPP
jgi:hypothetical protein